MAETVESDSAMRTMLPSLEQTLKQKKLWLALAGIVVTLTSSFVTWLTVSLSLASVGSFSFAPSLTVVFSGYDATWNVGYGVLGFRIIYIQLISTGIAFLALLLGIFGIAPSKYIRASMILIGGALGVLAPIGFVNALISQGQSLNAAFQQLSPIVSSLVQPNYSYALGPGLVLATLGPILLLASGIFVFREKKTVSLTSAGQV
jgi:hypothetical protein